MYSTRFVIKRMRNNPEGNLIEFDYALRFTFSDGSTIIYDSEKHGLEGRETIIPLPPSMNQYCNNKNQLSLIKTELSVSDKDETFVIVNRIPKVNILSKCSNSSNCRYEYINVNPIFKIKSKKLEIYINLYT